MEDITKLAKVINDAGKSQAVSSVAEVGGIGYLIERVKKNGFDLSDPIILAAAVYLASAVLSKEGGNTNGKNS